MDDMHDYYDEDVLEETTCEICGLPIGVEEFRTSCEVCGREYGNCCACENEDLNYCHICEERTRDKA